jgi:signal transduction histidine kinase
LSKIDNDKLLKNLLHATLLAAYMLLVFTLVLAIVVLPFGDPRELLTPPQWTTPLAGFSIMGAYITIIFGPAIGVSLIAALVVIVTTPHVSRWLRVGINDLIYGQHDDAFAIISQVNPHISSMNAPHAILPTITATIAQTMKLPYVQLEAENGDTPLVNTFGTLPPGATIERIPLLYQNSQIGELRVSARRSDEQLSRSDLDVLRDLARQVGIALYAAQLTDDLQRARIRLVTAREEERRRIRRDLHDGLGPLLASFAMQLEQAREHLPPDATESAAILSKLTTQAQGTVADVRRLVYDLRPADLDEFGLLSALREYIERNRRKGMTLRIEEPPILPTLPAAVEVAAYRIVQEAVNNALKHAQASEIDISVEAISQEVLSVAIRDNGAGIAPNYLVGIGLHSMHERAEELGGSCTIISNEKGTQVVAFLPIAVQDE